MNEIIIRPAQVSDAPKLLEIYAPYVKDTAITFEYDVPSKKEFASRIAHTLERYPYIVAQKDGIIAGYAYAGAFKSRAAYDWSVETSIYVARGIRKCGTGRALYTTLEKILKAMNIKNVNACIAAPEKEDEYLSNDSILFHERMGYTLAGTFHQCGSKFGRWYNMVWMEKLIASHEENPAPVLPFCAVQEQFFPKK